MPIKLPPADQFRNRHVGPDEHDIEHMLKVVGASSLVRVAIWILLVHAVDMYWLVMPALSPDGLTFHWTMITSFLGIGGLAIAFGIWRIRGHFTVPVRDPYIVESLAYRQP
jgi:hypothetical protein